MQQLIISSGLFFGLVICGGELAHSFSPALSTRASSVSIKQQQTSLSQLFSMPDDPYPSDYDAVDLQPTEQTVSVDIDEDDAVIRDELKRELILLASVTNRGMCASTEEENLVVDLVTQLEALNPTANPALNSQGDWELCYSSTQSFRSSPFFLAIRGFLGDDNKSIAENLFDIHDRATTASRVGKVRQIIDKDNQELVSEYELSVGLMPGIPLAVEGTVVTTAKLTAQAPETWELKVRGTKVNGSNVPFLDQYLDDNAVEIPVGDAWQSVSGSVPTAVLKTFYVDEGMRITRDVDDNFYVFTRA
jgi:hypothetical protein